MYTTHQLGTTLRASFQCLYSHEAPFRVSAKWGKPHVKLTLLRDGVQHRRISTDVVPGLAAASREGYCHSRVVEETRRRLLFDPPLVPRPSPVSKLVRKCESIQEEGERVRQYSEDEALDSDGTYH